MGLDLVCVHQSRQLKPVRCASSPWSEVGKLTARMLFWFIEHSPELGSEVRQLELRVRAAIKLALLLSVVTLQAAAFLGSIIGIVTFAI